MNQNDFQQIAEKARQLPHSSMRYLDYEDVADYDVAEMSGELILLLGYHKEAKCREYHWAAKDAETLAVHLKCKEPVFLTFIPRGWVPTLEAAGFEIRNAWHDYFLKSLDAIDCSVCDGAEFLAARECAEASAVTQACRGQSRGFTGQTPEWMANWIAGADAKVKNGAVLVKRAENGAIVGVVCTGTYAQESEKGPVAWIREAAVLPAYRNRGIARGLITQALACGKRHGATRAFLAVDEKNENAICLYTDLGFRPGGDESQIDMIRR